MSITCVIDILLVSVPGEGEGAGGILLYLLCLSSHLPLLPSVSALSSCDEGQ